MQPGSDGACPAGKAAMRCHWPRGMCRRSASYSVDAMMCCRPGKKTTLMTVATAIFWGRLK